MKILMVAIPNHHFFQWVNQLKASGHEVFWFDITDGGPKSEKIGWVQQIKGWKLRWDFPFRSAIKIKFPKLYKVIQSLNEKNVATVFKKTLERIKPDIVHCFEMQLAGLPILSIMEENSIPFIYSSWGSDVYFSQEIGIKKEQTQQFYNRVNYLITDCIRDYTLATKSGFKNTFLGVFPGNGGLLIDVKKIQAVDNRDIILIKGYDDGVGKASIVLKALEIISEEKLTDKRIVIYSADHVIQQQIDRSEKLSSLNITVHSRFRFLPNENVLALMGQSCIHIANSISDGVPNALLEAMGMGAFPIQSNPGNVTEEVITHAENGFLIAHPLDEKAIATSIDNALDASVLRGKAQEYNINFIQKRYNRVTLQTKIIELYKLVANDLHI